MSKAIITESKLTAIANAIRTKTGSASALTVDEMATEIDNIGLPSAYQEVEYIESTGTQYINSHIVPTDDIELEATIKQTELGAGDAQMRVMAVYENGQRCYLPNFWKYSSSSTKHGLCYGTIDNNYTFPQFINIGQAYIVNVHYTTSSQSVVVNKNANYDTSISTSTSITKPLFIFANNGTNGAEGFLKFKIYGRFKVKLNGTEAGWFVPCYRKSDNEIGLFNLTTRTFETNQGTGTFLKGGDV